MRDHIGGAEELGDLACHRLLHRLVGLNDRAVRANEAHREEVLVAGSSRRLPREELLEGPLPENAALWIHEVGHGLAPSVPLIDVLAAAGRQRRSSRQY